MTKSQRVFQWNNGIKYKDKNIFHEKIDDLGTPRDVDDSEALGSPVWLGHRDNLRILIYYSI